MQVSLVGFAVGAAFLSVMLFDVPYYLIGATLVAGRLVDEQLKVAERAPDAAEATATIAAVRQPSA